MEWIGGKIETGHQKILVKIKKIDNICACTKDVILKNCLEIDGEVNRY